jgi:hypothetical protein
MRCPSDVNDFVRRRALRALSGGGEEVSFLAVEER